MLGWRHTRVLYFLLPSECLVHKWETKGWLACLSRGSEQGAAWWFSLLERGNCGQSLCIAVLLLKVSCYTNILLQQTSQAQMWGGGAILLALRLLALRKSRMHSLTGRHSFPTSTVLTSASLKASGIVFQCAC